MFDLILKLDKKGFNGDEFRDCAASALRKRVKVPQGLPDDVIALLERWLESRQFDTKRDSASNEDKDDARGGSVLWGYGGTRILPHGEYPLISAYFFGLVARDPAPSKRILESLNRFLQKDCCITTWDAMAHDELRRLRFLDHTDAATFLENLFVAHPSLLQRLSGIFLVAHAISWASPELTRVWISRIGESQSDRMDQAFWELIVLRAMLIPSDSWSRNEIQNLLAQRSCSVGNQTASLRGAVYAAANLWADSSERLLLKKILCAGMGASDQGVARAAIDWFRVGGSLKFNEDTREVFEAFMRGKALEIAGERSYILDQVGDWIDDAPELVYNICRRLIEFYKQEIGNFASGAVLEAESLLSIALTLQRQSEPYRSKGLELFELLLQYKAYKAQEVLMDIDRRPGTSIRESQLRRRRRRRKRTTDG